MSDDFLPFDKRKQAREGRTNLCSRSGEPKRRCKCRPCLGRSSISIPLHTCKECGKDIARRHFPSGNKEAYVRWLNRRYCSRQCARKAQRVAGRTEKRCPRCEQTKPIEDFRWQPHRTGDGRDAYCQPCQYAYQNEWKKRQPLSYHRRRHLRKYGISLTEYREREASQGGVCAICHQPETVRQGKQGVKPLAVDHDATSGFVRGLLCQRCNQGLGNFREQPEWLISAALYLQEAAAAQAGAA